MNLRKSLLTTLVLIASILISFGLIWQGLNLDVKEDLPQVLGTINPSPSLIPSPASASASVSSSSTYFVSKVIDGDTIHIRIDNRDYPVRLIGVDTPETVDPRRPIGCFGKKASEETKRLLEGKNVILTKDISETDKYNRLLRYVFLPLGKPYLNLVKSPCRKLSTGDFPQAISRESALIYSSFATTRKESRSDG